MVVSIKDGDDDVSNDVGVVVRMMMRMVWLLVRWND